MGQMRCERTTRLRSEKSSQDHKTLPPSPQDGSTPLTAAAWGGHLDIVKLLLENGANIEAANNTVSFRLLERWRQTFYDSPGTTPRPQHGWNALMSAGSRGHGDVVEFLLQKNANSLVLDLHDTDAETYARQNKHYGVADTLKAAMVKQRAAVRTCRAPLLRWPSLCGLKNWR